MSDLRCADGHVSTAADYCSVCGLAIGGGTAPATATAPTAVSATAAAPALQCPNCAEPHGAQDVFCESCGLDFASGTLPDVGNDPAVTSISGGAPPVAVSASSGTLTVTVDPAHYARMDSDGQLQLPDPLPAPLIVPIHGSVLIGRAKPARGIHPDVDLAAAPHEDPAVSTRHAVIERRADGSWWVTDLGSTNGTYVGTPGASSPDDPIAGNSPVAIEPGTPVFVGAWTKLVVSADPD